MGKRFAVALSAADLTALPAWARGSASRNWSLILLGDLSGGRGLQSGADVVAPAVSPVQPWVSVASLLLGAAEDPPSFDYVWMLDASVNIEPAGIDRFFELAAALDLKLAQPAMSHDSPGEPIWAYQSPTLAVRFSDTIDLGLACISSSFLRQALPALSQPDPTPSLNHSIPRLLCGQPRSCAIIDVIPVRRPMRKAPAAPAEAICYGAIDREGRALSLFDETWESLLDHLRGALSETRVSDRARVDSLIAAQTAARQQTLGAGDPRPERLAWTPPEPAFSELHPGRRTRPTVGLVMVTTDAYALGKFAIERSASRFAFDRILVLSDRDTAWNGYPTALIPTLQSGSDYNEFVVNRLPQYVETDYFLVIQFDGFVLNPREFSPHFYHYDYIGAPWPWHPHCSVGNGGFSWRSRKLADAAAGLGYRQTASGAEDEFICRTHRVWLEASAGCEFAPIDIASHFSIEFGKRRFPTFGFHGMFHLPQVYRNDLDYLVENLTPRMLRSDAQFGQIAQNLKSISSDRHHRLQQRRAALLAEFSGKAA